MWPTALAFPSSYRRALCNTRRQPSDTKRRGGPEDGAMYSVGVAHEEGFDVANRHVLLPNAMDYLTPAPSVRQPRQFRKIITWISKQQAASTKLFPPLLLWMPGETSPATVQMANNVLSLDQQTEVPINFWNGPPGEGYHSGHKLECHLIDGPFSASHYSDMTTAQNQSSCRDIVTPWLLSKSASSNVQGW